MAYARGWFCEWLFDQSIDCRLTARARLGGVSDTIHLVRGLVFHAESQIVNKVRPQLNSKYRHT